jgi:parallel beta-helix repeat protein
LELSLASDVTITNNETARNARQGIHVTGCRKVHICGNLSEGNDRDGIKADALMDGCHEVEISRNLARNNGACGIRMDRASDGRVTKNSLLDNGNVRRVSAPDPKTIHSSRANSF